MTIKNYNNLRFVDIIDIFNRQPCNKKLCEADVIVEQLTSNNGISCYKLLVLDSQEDSFI